MIVILTDLMKELKKEKVLASTEKRPKKGKSSALEEFCTNVTQLAADNKLDPIISREKEIEEIITILSRRTKNNPILVGDPGVGKTAIVEGLSQRIVGHTVPDRLKEFQVRFFDV